MGEWECLFEKGHQRFDGLRPGGNEVPALTSQLLAGYTSGRSFWERFVD